MPQKSKFEELIERNESDLRIIRNQYFPLIRDGIITGYNLYKHLFDYSKGRLFLNYLHSDLRPKDRHFQELSKKLKNEGFLEAIVKINSELVDRNSIKERSADYLTKSEWEDSPKMRYFSLDGIELSSEEAKHLEEDLIGEVLQYDLLIKLNSEIELRQVIDIFKMYTSKFRLDKLGRKIIENGRPKYNDNAISEAWDVPLLVCTSIDNQKPKTLIDFLRVNQFNIRKQLGDTPVILSTFVRSKTKEFQNFLDDRGYRIKPLKKYISRVFVEDYINAQK